MGRTASVVPSAGGEYCEVFTGVGEDGSLTRYLVLAPAFAGNI
jgi:hypothetical protein